MAPIASKPRDLKRHPVVVASCNRAPDNANSTNVSGFVGNREREFMPCRWLVMPVMTRNKDAGVIKIAWHNLQFHGASSKAGQHH